MAEVAWTTEPPVGSGVRTWVSTNNMDVTATNNYEIFSFQQPSIITGLMHATTASGAPSGGSPKFNVAYRPEDNGVPDTSGDNSFRAYATTLNTTIGAGIDLTVFQNNWTTFQLFMGGSDGDNNLMHAVFPPGSFYIYVGTVASTSGILDYFRVDVYPFKGFAA